MIYLHVFSFYSVYLCAVLVTMVSADASRMATLLRSSHLSCSSCMMSHLVPGLGFYILLYQLMYEIVSTFHNTNSHSESHSILITELIYWLFCFEQVSNKHIHLLNKGSFGGRCISFPPFIIHVHRCIISSRETYTPVSNIRRETYQSSCRYMLSLDSIKGKYIL